MQAAPSLIPWFFPRVLSLFSVACIGLVAPAAYGEPAEEARIARPMKLGDVGTGSLLFKTNQPGRYVPAPVVTTKVDIRVSGMVARTVVRQTFYNPTESWLEGVYVFPLPDKTAVDHMRMQVGETVIEARIAEREAARRRYENARQAGRRAALVEQERPNIFTNSVANIAPKSAVSVELRYKETLRYDQGRFRLRFPMVVAPRYIPGPQMTVSADRGGWAGQDRLVPDADRITPPVLHPDQGKVNPVSLTVRLDAGMALAALASPYHQIKTDDWHDGKATITLADGAVAADRDFELVWTPKTGTAPVAGLFRETIGDAVYLLAMVLPPQDGGERAVPPRQVTYILDRSGSMGGASIRQAREALGLALARLRPVDRFNVIVFNQQANALFHSPRRATSENIATARQRVERIEADGGTEMLAALRIALGQPSDGANFQQIVFLTDGAVGNEVALFKEIDRDLGKRRLFTVGIGSAPNSFFMRKAAEAGRGSYVHIGRIAEVRSRMDDLLKKIERPAATDLAYALPDDANATAYPRILPDLYDGEPVLLAIRLPKTEADAPGAALTLSGLFDGKTWQRTLTLGTARDADGISSIWARSRIEALTDSLRTGANPDIVRAAITETALRHSLVSRYTSLVAVETDAARPDGAPLVSRDVPLNLPDGWNYEKVFGPMLHRAAAPAPVKKARAANGVPATDAAEAATRRVQVAMAPPTPMPRGATPAPLMLIAGLLSLLLAALCFIWYRRAAVTR